VAISPLLIIVVILMLGTKRARSNGPAFIPGWIVGLAMLGCLVLALIGVGKIFCDHHSSTLAYGTKLLLGLLFFLLAYFTWQKRPQPGKEPQLPPRGF